MLEAKQVLGGRNVGEQVVDAFRSQQRLFSCRLEKSQGLGLFSLLFLRRVFGNGSGVVRLCCQAGGRCGDKDSEKGRGRKRNIGSMNPETAVSY